MICRLYRDGKGCVEFHPIDGCSIYTRAGMKGCTRRGVCPRAGKPNSAKKVEVKVRVGQQKQKKH